MASGRSDPSGFDRRPPDRPVLAGPPTACLHCFGELTADTVVPASLAVLRDVRTGAFVQRVGGMAADVAWNVRVLGQPSVRLWGCAGADDAAEHAIAELRAVGIDADGVVRAGRTRQRILDSDGDGRRRVVVGGERSDWSRVAPSVGRGEIAFFESWHLVDDERYGELMSRAQAQGGRIATCLPGVQRDGVDAAAVEAVLERARPEVLVADAADMDALGLDDEQVGGRVGLLVVHGEGVPTRVRQGRSSWSFPVEASEPGDLVGVEEAFVAGLLFALASGRDIRGTVRRARVTAAFARADEGVRLPGRPRSAGAKLRAPQSGSCR
jgi:sugar/nucleoside kinase (ribokinase family)